MGLLVKNVRKNFLLTKKIWFASLAIRPVNHVKGINITIACPVTKDIFSIIQSSQHVYKNVQLWDIMQNQ